MVSSYRKTNKILEVILFSVSLLFCPSCQSDFGEFKLCENYSVVSVDTKENSSLSFNLGDGAFIERIPGRIVSVEWGGRYIIAERSHNGDAPQSYYILDKQNDQRYAEPEDSVTGPLSASQLVEAKKRKKIPKSLPHSKKF